MGAALVLDVRSLAPKERYPKIFEAFDGLKAGETLEVVSDHDPRPLYYQFLHERAGRFRWALGEAGPEIWKAAISRVSEGTGEKGSPPDGSGGPKPDWINRLNPSFEVFLDVRPMMEKGMEPFQLIMNTAEELRDNQYFRLVSPFEMVSLYGNLERLGFGHFAECRGGIWNLYLKRISERKFL